MLVLCLCDGYQMLGMTQQCAMVLVKRTDNILHKCNSANAAYLFQVRQLRHRACGVVSVRSSSLWASDSVELRGWVVGVQNNVFLCRIWG